MLVRRNKIQLAIWVIQYGESKLKHLLWENRENSTVNKTRGLNPTNMEHGLSCLEKKRIHEAGGRRGCVSPDFQYESFSGFSTGLHESSHSLRRHQALSLSFGGAGFWEMAGTWPALCISLPKDREAVNSLISSIESWPILATPTRHLYRTKYGCYFRGNETCG